MPKSFRTHTIASIKRMGEDMLLRGMAVRTIDSYTYHVSSFSKRFGKLPEDLGPEQIREFQLWMVQEKKCSWSSYNQAVCGLRFLYTATLPRPWVVSMIPYGNRPKKLPVVLGQEEVHRLIECVTVPKHRAVLLTLYAAGLILGNRRELYRTLMHAAWESLKECIESELGMQASAMMVLHTWNQRLEHHPHVHLLVPGSGPSLDGQRWIECQQPLELIAETRRPSWRDLFYGPDHQSWFES